MNPEHRTLSRCARLAGLTLGLLLWTCAPLWATEQSQPIATLPPGDAAADYSFVVWGHWRGPRDGDPPLHLEAVLDQLRELKPDFVLILGDTVSGGAGLNKPLNPDLIRADWQRVDDALEELGIPVYMVPGNHDVNNLTTRDIFLERYPQPPYAFTHEDSRFIVLDTVGIEQRAGDKGRYWDLLGLPLDAKQLDFVGQELAEQDRYRHLFFFMHHTHLWAKADGQWWSAIQPMLKGGRTRAVFSGDPYGGKFGYTKRDGVVFIKTAMYETPDTSWFRRYTNNRFGWAMMREPDLLQQVLVRGDEVEIRSIVVDPLNTETLSVDFWQEVHASFNWRQNLATWFHRNVYRLSHLVILLATCALVAFALGVIATLVWSRWRQSR